MKTTLTKVRGIELRLAAYTRALELCARMNREAEVLDFIDGIEEGQVLYDLGACEGRFALYAALRGIHCYAFEPEEMNFQVLLQNIDLNGDRAKAFLTPLRLAVGESNHTTRLRIAQPWAGGHQKVVASASGRVDLDFAFTEEQEVEVVALDDVIASRKLPAPDYLKVDVDGSEISFVRGAKQTLTNSRLQGVIVELCQRDKSYSEVVAFLKECGLYLDKMDEVESGLFNVLFKRPRP